MRIIGLLAAVGWLASASSAAEQPALIQNVPGRQTIDLCGPWRAIVDPYEAGYLDYRYRPYADGGMGAIKKPKSPGEFVEYDFDAAGELLVPGDWNTQKPELLFYEGSIWYKKDFDYTRKPGRRQFLTASAAGNR